MSMRPTTIVKRILFYLVVFIHGIVNMILFFSPYLVNNTFYLSAILLFYFIYFLLRYNIGYCVITFIENWLNPAVVQTVNKSYFRIMMSEYIGNSMSKKIFFIVPLIGMGYTFIRLYFGSSFMCDCY